MPWLAIIQFLFWLAKALVERRLNDSPALQGELRNNAEANLSAIRRALSARDSVRDDSDSVHNDPDNIDGPGSGGH